MTGHYRVLYTIYAYYYQQQNVGCDCNKLILQMISTLTVILPNEEAKARLKGKGGRKVRDIELVTGAKILIEKLVVVIRAQSEQQAVMAKQLILKSESHRLAANAATGKQSEVDRHILYDLRMAAFYTTS